MVLDGLTITGPKNSVQVISTGIHIPTAGTNIKITNCVIRHLLYLVGELAGVEQGIYALFASNRVLEISYNEIRDYTGGDSCVGVEVSGTTDDGS